MPPPPPPLDSPALSLHHVPLSRSTQGVPWIQAGGEAEATCAIPLVHLPFESPSPPPPPLIRSFVPTKGVPWIQAGGEAEATCAILSRNGVVDGCQTKDVDSLLFGAEEVYKEVKLVVSAAAIFCEPCMHSLHLFPSLRPFSFMQSSTLRPCRLTLYHPACF